MKTIILKPQKPIETQYIKGFSNNQLVSKIPITRSNCQEKPVYIEEHNNAIVVPICQTYSLDGLQLPYGWDSSVNSLFVPEKKLDLTSFNHLCKPKNFELNEPII